MKRRLAGAVVVLVVACSTQQKTNRLDLGPPLAADAGLKSVADFASIDGDEDRSRALFGELSKVLMHPRCTNCHPAAESPLQGNDSIPHRPLVVRGEDGHGAPGMRCDTCHGPENFQNVPGSPEWHLAPVEMAWTGKSAAEICAQIKDPERNGGLDFTGLVKHVAEDELVGWGWAPPKHLEPAPGNQRLFAQLTQAWIDSGAHCPE